MTDQEEFDLTKTNNVLHVIRNPYGWNDHIVRDARLKAADLIERQAKELAALRKVLTEIVEDGYFEVYMTHDWGITDKDGNPTKLLMGDKA